MTAAAADRPVVVAFMGVVLFGALNAIAVKATVQELAPFWSATLRLCAAAAVLAAVVVLRRRAFPRGRSLWGAMLYGAVGLAASSGFLYVALRDVPVGTASVFLALVPLLTFGLAILQRQEQFHVQGLVGGVVAVVGVAMVFADQASATVALGPMLLVLAGVTCIAESAVIVHWIPRSDPFATNVVAMLTGGVLLLGASIAAGEPWVTPTQPATLAALLYLVLLGSAVMFALYVFTLERWPASRVSYATLLMPIVTVGLVTIVGGERVSPAFLAGGAVILAGVYAGAFLRGRPGRTSATSAPECLPVDACAPPEIARLATSSRSAT